MTTEKGGRPRCFDSQDELEDMIERYFEYCDDHNKPYTIAGLAVWLEVDRKTIYNYEKKEEYFHIIKRAREIILASWEERVILEGKPGQIFLMKNYGYTDKSDGELKKLEKETAILKQKLKIFEGDSKDLSKLETLLDAITGD